MLSYTTLWNIAISELACPVCCWKWTCSLWSQWHCENFNRKLANCCFGQRNQNLDKWPKFISWVHSDVKFSVVWDLICSVMFKIYRFTNLLLNILVKEFWNLVNIWKSCFWMFLTTLYTTDKSRLAKAVLGVFLFWWTV